MVKENKNQVGELAEKKRFCTKSKHAPVDIAITSNEIFMWHCSY